MSQQTVVRSTSKEYIFTMSNTKIDTFTSTEQGFLVSGQTDFTMNIDVNTNDSAAKGVDYVVPDFNQKLAGTVKLEADAPVVELRRIPIEEAKQIIYEYLKAHPGSRTSDLIMELELDPDIVIEALSQLKCEDKVEGKDIVRT